MKSDKNRTKVLLGLSGGLDSSVAAYILKQQGYDVIGGHIHLYPKDKTPINKTTDIEKVASSLDISLYTINMEKEFKKYVTDNFINEYRKGYTPNPCILCNRFVKFQGLLDLADKMSIKYIATGHYANIYKKRGRYYLKKGIDKKKDQSYFLYRLTQEQLSRTLFPLGAYHKKEIRNIAKQLGFEVSDIPESQDVCFIENNNYYDFVNKHSTKKEAPGEIVDKDNTTLGYHKGISKYTIGQRKGLGYSFKKAMYIVDIDAEDNKVIVGSEQELYKDELIASDLNWIAIKNLGKKIKVKAKVRYQGKEERAVLIPIKKDTVKVKFNKKIRAVTRGQSIVFYKRNYVVGGGVIR